MKNIYKWFPQVLTPSHAMRIRTRTYVYGLRFDRLHALFATETLLWPYEVATTSQMGMCVGPIAEQKVSETFPLLTICGYNKIKKIGFTWQVR